MLAGPCGVAVPDEATARSLFKRLAKQVVLVTEVGPDVLLHRTDLRTVMLEPLRAAEGEEGRRYSSKCDPASYARFDDVESRAEELYHRFSLGLDRKGIEARWNNDPGWVRDMRKALGNSVAELPPASQAFVAARLEVEVAQAVRRTRPGRIGRFMQ